MTAADRPSVTDNARAEAWDQGHRVACAYFPDCQTNGHHDLNPYRAAGRAETTTATTEDAAAEVIATHTPELINEGPNGEDDGQHLYCVECGVLPIDGRGLQYGPEHVVEHLRARGLLATARTRPAETTTEWGVRNRLGDVHPLHEHAARHHARNWPDLTVVRREVTAWTEAE